MMLGNARSLCGIKDCDEQALHLYAWPGRNPVPLCDGHADIVDQLHQNNPMTPKQWMGWLNTHAKQYILKEH